jgi:hypothetical protein
VDPDCEIITAAEVGPANGGDAAMAQVLLADLPAASPGGEPATEPAAGVQLAPVPVLYGDSAYGTGQVLAHLDQPGITPMTKVAPLHAPAGRFAKDQVTIDLAAQTVTCPARLTVAIIPHSGGGGLARFGRACPVCPLASACTTSRSGRTITVHRHEALLARARVCQHDPAWRSDYRSTRPKVEHKLAQLARRRHGGRRARVRGLLRVGQDFKLLAAAVNLARLAVLDAGYRSGGWTVTAA